MGNRPPETGPPGWERPGPTPETGSNRKSACTTTDNPKSSGTADILDTFGALYGDTIGFLHVGAGADLYLKNGKPTHRRWGERVYEYPAQAGEAARDIAAGAAEFDTYVCSNLMRGRIRAKGAAVARRLPHADVDGQLDIDRVHEIGGFAIASGTAGHGHVYVPVAEELTVTEYEVLCRGLVNYFGADPGKVSDNDFLRPAGTFNHKPVLTGGVPAPVRWLVRPVTPPAMSKHKLASRLGITLPPAYETNGHKLPHTSAVPGAGPAVGVPEPVDLAGYPRVKAALDLKTDDRSADIMRVVGASFDDGLTLPQARTAVNTRSDLVEKLAELGHDDVQRCWLKAIDDRQNLQWMNGEEPDDAGGTGKVAHSAHLGMAVKMAMQFANKLLYVHGVGWHCWDGMRYAPDGNGAARRAVHTVIRRERAKAAKLPLEEREKRAKQLARYETASAISGILTEAAVLEGFSVELSDVDNDPWLFNCRNGTLDLRTLQLRDHNPADRITKVANAAYRTDTTGADWRGFLEKVLPDTAVRDYTQRLIGLSLLGEVNGDKQVAPIATGPGANGKTTLVETVSYALGDYAMPAEPTLLMAKRGDAHPTGIADLLGKRFVSVVETEQGRRFDITLLKWLTGGDELKARFMRQNFFRFRPSHLLMMATNHLPRVDDDTEAVWRRIRVIPFTVQIPRAERDKHLKDRLCAEADAVLGWAIDGWKDYRRRDGLDEPDAVLVATNDYKDESDAVGRFVADECLVGGAQSSATTKTLYECWQRWAAQDGCLPLSMIAFGRALDAKGYPTDPKAHDRRRHRICLRSVENTEWAGR